MTTTYNPSRLTPGVRMIVESTVGPNLTPLVSAPITVGDVVEVLHYGTIHGTPYVRAYRADSPLSRRTIDFHPEALVRESHLEELARARASFEIGDRVVVESPIYYGFDGVLEDHSNPGAPSVGDTVEITGRSCFTGNVVVGHMWLMAPEGLLPEDDFAETIPDLMAAFFAELEPIPAPPAIDWSRYVSQIFELPSVEDSEELPLPDGYEDRLEAFEDAVSVLGPDRLVEDYVEAARYIVSGA